MTTITVDIKETDLERLKNFQNFKLQTLSVEGLINLSNNYPIKLYKKRMNMLTIQIPLNDYLIFDSLNLVE